jgi:signal transduction histidine kinase
MPPVTGLTIGVLTAREELARLVGDTLGEWLPQCSVLRAAGRDDEVLRRAGCIVLDAAHEADASGLAAAVPVVLLVDRAQDASSGALPSGAAAVVPVAAVPQVLAGVVAAAVAERGSPDVLAAAGDSLEETRRLIARGRLAAVVQHAANNPLAALLTEAQLMELDPLPAEQLAAVRRIVELSRRVAATLRRLDGPAERP